MWWNFLNNITLSDFIIPVVVIILTILGLIQLIKWIF